MDAIQRLQGRRTQTPSGDIAFNILEATVEDSDFEDSELHCLTIHGVIHTHITNCGIEEAEHLIKKLVAHGVLHKLRPGRTYISRYGQADDDTLQQKKKAKQGVRLGVTEIWLVGEVEDADRTYEPPNAQ
jgi:hypothetical protein